MAPCRSKLRPAQLLAVSDVRVSVSAGAHGLGKSYIVAVDAVGVDGFEFAARDVLAWVRGGSDHQSVFGSIFNAFVGVERGY